MQRCQKCDRDGNRVDVISDIAWVDYYRCAKCGEVWTAQKDDRGSLAPEPILTDDENLVA